MIFLGDQEAGRFQYNSKGSRPLGIAVNLAQGFKRER